MAGKQKTGIVLMGILLLGLTGCSKVPETLNGTSWRITELTAPDGTKYEGAAYDAIIGTTVYTFEDGETMVCYVDGERTETYEYAYEDGTLAISSDTGSYSGEVKKDRMRLPLGEEGEAILTPEKSEE